MQMNFRDVTPAERKVIRIWRVRVAVFYSTLCVILLLLSLVGDRSTPNVAGAPSSYSLDTLAAR